MGEIVQLKKTRMPRSRDAFYQAIPVNEIQGQFFYFGRNKIPDVELFKREKDKAEKHAEALPEDKEFQIFYDPRFGVPGPLAYRIWTGIEKFLSDAGSNFDGRLKLSTRQIARLAGRSFSGQAAKEISLAIKQLQNSTISYWYEDETLRNEDGSPQIREEQFALLDKVSLVREDRKSAPHYYVITVPEIILGFLFHDRYFFCMSWDRVKDLSPQSQSVARILYRYMSYRYSKAKTENFRYTKDYATMCHEWFGGITPYAKMSEIKRKHLAPRFDPIIESSLLQGYEVERNKAKDGFNVHFFPGKEFFTDFSAFYSKQLPLNFNDYKSNHDTHLGRPETNLEDGAFALVGHFHEHWFGKDAERDYIDAEIKFAQSVLKEMQLDEAKKFVSWAILRARETKFDLQLINGLKQYLSKWKSEHKREDARLQKMAADQARDKAALDAKLYEDFCMDETRRILDSLDAESRDQITQAARKKLQEKFPDMKEIMSGHLLSAERRIVRDNLDLPDFETWLSQRNT